MNERNAYMNNENRMIKNKNKIHQNILEVASRIISEKGASNITFEALSVEADVARKTIYNHFENKSALLDELIYPICEHAKDYLAVKTDNKYAELDDIWDYCIELWRDPTLNAALLYQITEQDYPQIHEIKSGFIILFKKFLMRIEAFKRLDEMDITILSDTIYTSYLPLLRSLKTIQNYEVVFKAGMNGLINGIFEKMKDNQRSRTSVAIC